MSFLRILQRMQPFIAPLGMLIVLIASSVTVETPGTAPIRRNWVIGKLDRDHVFDQTFVVDQINFSAIRVLLLPSFNDQSDEPVILRLRTENVFAFEVASVTLPVRDLSRQGMTSFTLPAMRIRATPHTITTTLRLTLEAPTIPPAAGISVIAGPDDYPHGEAWINGQPRPDVDLAFQPIYQQRWLDRLAPISKLADGKPGLAGWPPLYALLIYGYAYIAAIGFARLWRRFRPL